VVRNRFTRHSLNRPATTIEKADISEGVVFTALVDVLPEVTIGDLSKVPIEILERKFGSLGCLLHQSANAIDSRPVQPERVIKSLGNEDTFSTNLVDMEPIKRNLLALSVKVGERVRQHGLTGKTVTLKVKYYDFITVTRSFTMVRATSDTMSIYHTGLHLLTKTLAGKKPVRLLGIYLTGLHHSEHPTQGLLFSQELDCGKKKKLNEAIDSINKKFTHGSGQRKIKPARLL